MLSLLGTFQFTADGVPVSDFRTDKIRALLAFLAMESDRPHQRQTLAALLWPEMSSSVALANLRKSLHRLIASVEGASPSQGPPLFTVTRQAIQVDQDSLTVDALSFQSLLDTCARHPHRHLHLCHDCLTRMAQAVNLFRGDFLAGFSLPDCLGFDAWALGWQEHLRFRLSQTLAQLALAHAERRDYAVAQSYAARHVVQAPYNDAAVRTQMRILAQYGRRDLALAAYADLCQRLDVDLDSQPEMETTALHVRIWGGGDPWLAPVPVHPAHFPTQFTTVLGREAELAQLHEMLLDPTCRLPVIVGPGGSGKTRLAIAAAEQTTTSGLFPDGIIFVSLVDAVCREELVTALARNLDLSLGPGSNPQAEVLDFLHARRCLLVLDGFEQLAVQAGLLVDILDAAPQTRVLVTSRHTLNLRAERPLRLSGLAYPESLIDAQGVPLSTDLLLSYSAVRLFVHAAQRVRPGFTLTEANQAHVVRICQLVHGMPLSLELAGAWARFLSSAAIAEQIAAQESALDFLISPGLDMPERHSSLAAVFAFSWNLLSQPEQLALALCGVFRGWFTLEAATAVTQASLPDLAALVDKSLLQLGESGDFTLCTHLRQFAARQLTILDPTGSLAQAAQARQGE